ncbi:MAG: class I SAM-dependent methyltransferase [Ruminiclostridium sp.]|nr:class I SAM-dependent methyltransferase [Ruminiclostridium sp.]
MDKFLNWLSNKASVADTRKEFEASFASGSFYDRQTQDSGHLENILRFLDIRAGMKILDLGTGSGYLSFPIAKENPGCEVVGLDVVRDALEVNRKKAVSEGIGNLSFVSYDGIDFPFEYGTFDLIVTRYALHHFPDIEHGIGEVSRVLKQGGALFISDPCPNDCDTERFVDDYMRLKKDGHIRFYTKDEWLSICGRHGLKYADSFDSTIRFPKKKDTALGYEDVLRRHERSVIYSYDLVETETELYVTERVNNILFVKE